jgi:hypothetical protein
VPLEVTHDEPVDHGAVDVETRAVRDGPGAVADEQWGLPIQGRPSLSPAPTYA